jgi:hypothetical protein
MSKVRLSSVDSPIDRRPFLGLECQWEGIVFYLFLLTTHDVSEVLHISTELIICDRGA